MYLVARMPRCSPTRWRSCLIDRGNAGFAVEFDEGVALGHDFEFTHDHGLVANEGPIEVVRERHVATGFPIADGLGLLEFASEGGLRADVEPESEIRAKSHGVETGEVVAIDAANDAAGNQSKNETVGENDCAGAKAGTMRCSSWSKKSVAYISASVRRVTAFLASSSSMSRPTRFERRRPLV